MEDQNYDANEAHRAALRQEIERLRNLLRNEQMFREAAEQKLKQYQLCMAEIVKSVNKYKLQDF